MKGTVAPSSRTDRGDDLRGADAEFVGDALFEGGVSMA